MATYGDVIAAYGHQAEALAPGYEAVSSAAMLGDSLAGLTAPVKGSMALDVGAGTGRDAAWLLSLGYEVVAVEPAAGMRRIAAELHTHAGIRWIDDALPALDQVHGLGISFDLVLASAVWQHVRPEDRGRALRKLATLTKPGGSLVVTLREGPSPADRPMHPTSAGEIEALARSHGMEVLRITAALDHRGRAEVSWQTAILRMPDDGSGALPLVRGIVLSVNKSSTYKLALLRAVGRAAELSPASATPAPDGRDAVEIPLGLVALHWLRMYLPLVRAGLPQMPGNLGHDRLGFAKSGFLGLLDAGIAAPDLRIGASFTDAAAIDLSQALGAAATTIADMPANYTRYPNGDDRVFQVTRARASRQTQITLDLPTLRGWGLIEVPGNLWRAMMRYGAWIEPMLTSEWARLTRSYADRMGLSVPPGQAEASLAWIEPVRSVSVARMAALRLSQGGEPIECVWTGRSLAADAFDVDHCLPWSAWPCGDLWNLMPAHERTNRHEKRERLPSAAALAGARSRIIHWWSRAYLDDDALRSRFMLEASAALPLLDSDSPISVHAALDWRRLRLRQDQQVPEWTPRNMLSVA
ncbi:methyltransferase domain-containing protein [Sphingomonas sp. UYP23]